MGQSLLKRGEDGEPLTEPDYTPQEEIILRVLALVFASVGIISTILTLYWFLTIRRSFRHHDMIKALSYIVYAITALTPGNVVTTPVFCQVSGFFTAAGVELSDFAVLMIAVHSALYIFIPPASIGEGGLYPYRYVAYGLWIVLPLLMASLAFTNPREAYIAGGVSCSLPVRPFWYLLALSWIPRYLIFVLILGIDASIYLFIIRRFGYFTNGTDTSAHLTTTEVSQEVYEEYHHEKAMRINSLPPLPALAYNGLIPKTEQPLEVPLREPSTLISRLRKHRPQTLINSPILRWPKLDFQRQTTITKRSPGTASSSPLENNSVTKFDHQLPTMATQQSTAAIMVPAQERLSSTRSSWSSISASLNSRSQSTVSLASFLRLPQRNVSFGSDVSIRLHDLELVDSRGRSCNMQMRKNIRRQLRFLFVYPLTYLAMWTIPFIFHTLQYNDYYAMNPPFALNAIVTVILTSQSTVNCWIFNIKEKPWIHSSRKKSLSIPGLGVLTELALGRNSKSPGGRGGKGKEVMKAEARLAYRRRDEEVAARASETNSVGRSQRQERSWWDDMEDTIDC